MTQDSHSRASVAVIGSGIAGIAAAYRLDQRARVTLYEANPRLGGHTHTVVLPEGPDAGTPVDTGFIVFNEHNYPGFSAFLRELNVAAADSDMSFSYSIADSAFCYSSIVPRGLFACRRNAVDPRFWRMLIDILRFNRRALADLAAARAPEGTLEDYIRACGCGRWFAERYLLAQGAAIWSCPAGELRGFPATSFLHFFRNHGLLQIRGRPRWRYVKGGSQRYLDAFASRFTGALRTGTPVRAVTQDGRGVAVHTANGPPERFDAVVIATHADQALAMLETPHAAAREALATWRYSTNRAVLHSDASLMPTTCDAWASWNVVREAGQDEHAPLTLTYHMNRLQRLETQEPLFVTLNPMRAPRADRVIQEIVYTHPVYSAAAVRSQPVLRALNGTGPIAFAGSYMGYGFHEDGYQSGCAAAVAIEGAL